MICPLHPANGEQTECEACKLNFPPDLGVYVSDEVEIEELLS